jgi:hypothetical protein
MGFAADVRGGLRVSVLSVAFAGAFLGLSSLPGRSGEEENPGVQRHLAIARAVVAAVRPDHNRYVHDSTVVWSDGLLSSDVTAFTDCSGFLGSVLRRAGNRTYDIVEAHSRFYAHHAHYPLARDYYHSIVHGWGFENVGLNVASLRPGDVIAVLFPPGGGDTGHVMIVDAMPVQRQASPPLVDGTAQWAVTIIDSSGGHGPPDSRSHGKGAPDQTGVGRGVVRLYTDADGQIVGYAWSLAKASRFRDRADVPVAVGRPLPDIAAGSPMP